MHPSATDLELINRYQNGESEAYAQIVQRYWDRIFARSYQLLRNREDAEEITQDTFIRAQKGLENFRGEAAFSTWLYQIATNLSHNRYWYWWRRRRDASVSLDYRWGEDQSISLEEMLPADGETPGQAAVTKEFVQRVSEGMKKLSPKHREILTLRNINNLSYEDIAAELKISVGTVKSRIARARESLREALGKDFQ